MEPRQIGSGPLRALAYVFALFLLPPVAAHLARQHDLNVNCNEGGECDLAGLAAFGAAVETVVLIVAVMITIEVTLRIRRRRTASAASQVDPGSS